MTRIIVRTWLAAVGLLCLECSGASSSEAPGPGTYGGPCVGGDLCDVGLVCDRGMCVQPSGGGGGSGGATGAGGGADAAGPQTDGAPATGGGGGRPEDASSGGGAGGMPHDAAHADAVEARDVRENCLGIPPTRGHCNRDFCLCSTDMQCILSSLAPSCCPAPGLCQ
jgi:hypothetical protein